MQISTKVKKEIFNIIKIEINLIGLSVDDKDIMTFLSEIWDLEAMGSTDPRYTTAYRDIYQHIVNNDDWDVDYLFLERLKLLEDDIKYILFLEKILHPEYDTGKNTSIEFTWKINELLERDGYRLVIVDFADGNKAIYRVEEKSVVGNLPVDLKLNTIPFFVVTSLTPRSNKYNSHSPPSVFPAFVLVFDYVWNDYFKYQTKFSLFYYAEKGSSQYVGSTKIMKKGSTNTIEQLPEKFTLLSDEFCSIGQIEDYYVRLKQIMGRDFESVLFALQDAAFFTEIQDRFEDNKVFIDSLIRYDTVERLLREAKHVMNGNSLTDLYKFNYNFKMPYADNFIKVNFDFSDAGELPNRIYALIGKNGTGKTQLITSLPNNISERKVEFFDPRIPEFSKVIAVSYSLFDNFKIPKKSAAFNYVNCGFRDEAGKQLEERSKILKFHHTWKKIKEKERLSQWRKVLLNFLDESIVDQFLIENEEDSQTDNYEMSIDGFKRVRQSLSSGQSILLYTISEIVANIRYDSLLLYDEPETHLHPNAIVQLMNTIFELVTQFQSYCIVATHSPLIIRELLSKSVYIVERNEAISSVRKIGIESFGENLTTLTEEVFGNREIPKQYKKIIEGLVENGKSFDEIVSMLSTPKIPLSLNASIYIKSLIKNSDA